MGYVTFFANLIATEMHANPIMLVFLMCINGLEYAPRIPYLNKKLSYRVSKNAKLRWHLMCILVRNPTIVKYRKHLL